MLRGEPREVLRIRIRPPEGAFRSSETASFLAIGVWQYIHCERAAACYEHSSSGGIQDIGAISTRPRQTDRVQPETLLAWIAGNSRLGCKGITNRL